MQARALLFVLVALCCVGVRETQADAKPAATNPYLENALPAAGRHWLVGHVEERVLAGNYVYLRLREPSGLEAWLVALRATTPTAADVRALVVGRADHFHSRMLERDFSPLLFAAVRADQRVDTGSMERTR